MPLIPIKSIAVINRQRKEMDVDALKDLAASIQANGLFHPVVVRQPFDHEKSLLIEGQTHVLSMGGRRLAAHLLLGRSDIEANFKEGLDPITAEICELDENLKRANLSWQEEVEARARIAQLISTQNPKANIREVAEEMGISHAQLSKDITLSKQIKQDPTLKSANSKGSAVRSVQFKAAINDRIRTIKAADIGNLRAKLFTADGRDFVRQIPSQSVDLVFSDLPYGIGYFDVRKGATADTKGSYDDSSEVVKDFIADVVPECLRVVKPTGWVVFFMCYEWHDWLQTLIRDTCKTHWSYRERFADNSEMNQCMTSTTKRLGGCEFFRPELPPWIWTRRGRGNHGHWPELHASNRYEMIVVANGGNAKLTRKPVENVLDFPPFEGERLHEMQKPHELCREIISRTTVIGERVLDICFGSGAHLAAAASLGRDFVGCDNDPRNLDSALSLVSQFYSKEVAAAIKKPELVP